MVARLQALREWHRRPGPGYRELRLDGERCGWLPPTWILPMHRCVMVRTTDWIVRAFVESVDELEVRCRPWTPLDTADMVARSKET